MLVTNLQKAFGQSINSTKNIVVIALHEATIRFRIAYYFI